MPERHDNTRPAIDGSISISPYGVICYYPIEKSGYLKPFIAMVLHEKPDGEITAAIDMRWGPVPTDEEA